MPNPLYNYGLPTTVTGGGTPAVTTGEVENGGSNGTPHTPPANTATVFYPGGSPSEEMVGLNTPVLTTIAPTTAVHATANGTVTCTGTGFKSGTVARVDGVAQPTTYVSPTSVTYQGQHLTQAAAGTVQVSVANLGIVSANKPFVYT